MKHSFFLFFVTVVIGSLTVSCSSDLTEETNSSEQTIQRLHVSIDEMLPGDAETRANLEYKESGGKRSFDFTWAADDVLGVFPNEGAQAFFPIGEEFAGQNSADFDGGGWALKTGYSYSLYCPYDYGNTEKTAIPLNYLNQKQMANNDYSHLNNYNYFSSKQAIVATGPELDFKVGFVGSIFWFIFTVPEDGTFTKLRLVSDEIPFIRTGYLDISGEAPTVSEEDESTTMTLKLNNITASAGEVLNLYMWVLPRDFRGNMFRAELVTDDMRVYTVNLTDRLNAVSGTFYSFARGGAGQVQFDAEVGKEPEYIVFEDEEVEKICLANWDTNKDDVLDAAEAAAVTDLGGVFNNNTIIASFDELKYFTGLTEINQDAFSNCSLLHTVTIPDNVKIIREGAFLCCSSLYYLTLPEGLERIDSSAFNACINMGAITIPNSVEYIGDFSYYQSRNAAWVDLPSELIEIGESAFSHSTPISSVDFAESEKLVKIGKEAFYACTTMQEVVFPESLTTIEEGAFEHCWNLKKIVIPKEDAIVSIGEGAFDVSDCPIYVPAALLSDYKDAYPEYESRFSSLESQDGGTVISNPDMQGGW